MKIKQIIFCCFCIILVCIVYNYYKTDDDNLAIENFESILKGLNSNKNNNDIKKKKKNNNNNSDDDSYTSLSIKKSLKSLKSKKTGTTFDDLFKATENMDPDKLTIESMQKELSKYYDTFKKEKFKNNSKSTAESFEKFKFYKEQFFNIFK